MIENNQIKNIETTIKQRVYLEQRANKRSFLILIISIVIGSGWLGISFMKVSQLQNQAIQLEIQIQQESLELSKKEDSIKMKTQLLKMIVPGVLREYGWNKDSIKVTDIDHPKVLQSLEAQKQLSNLGESTDSTIHDHHNITLRYYPKEFDQQKVEEALSELGYKMDKRPVQVPDVPTNSIWYGSKVSIKDVKRIALTLIRAGIELKAIRPFATENYTGTKSQFIEIGADKSIVLWKVIDVVDIDNALKYGRIK